MNGVLGSTGRLPPVHQPIGVERMTGPRRMIRASPSRQVRFSAPSPDGSRRGSAGAQNGPCSLDDSARPDRHPQSADCASAAEPGLACVGRNDGVSGAIPLHESRRSERGDLSRDRSLGEPSRGSSGPAAPISCVVRSHRRSRKRRPNHPMPALRGALRSPFEESLCPVRVPSAIPEGLRLAETARRGRPS